MTKEPRFRLAFVTGATSGIGEALCYLLAAQGINLMITGRKASKLKELKQALQDQVTVSFFVADLATVEGREHAMEQMRKHLPDLVINNAGMGFYGDLLSIPIELQHDTLNVNAMAVLDLSVEAARLLKAKGEAGVIMNVASAVAFQPAPGFAVYAAAKAFVLSFSEGFAEEVAPYGIQVLVSCPGVVRTKFRSRASQKSDKKYSSWTMTAEYAARKIWQQICKGKRVVVFDWKYRILLFLSHYFLPKKVMMAIIHRSVRDI